MKKRICLILAVLMGALLALTACASPLPPSLIKKIKTAYLKTLPEYNLTAKNLTLEYVMEFDGAYIVRIECPALGIYPSVNAGFDSETDGSRDGEVQPLWFEIDDDYYSPMDIISGVIFDPYMDFLAYYDGEIYSIQEAAKNKILTHENLLTLQEIRRKIYTARYRLHDQIAENIQTAYLELHPTDSTGKQLTEDDVSLYVYGAFGYGDVYVVMIYAGTEIVDDLVTTVLVDGVAFEFPDTKVFDVYYGGKFYTLQEAFDSELLTHDKLLEVQENWNNR